ncbi:MAG: AAA family ATPase [Candidatus Helarchaeota archaeon]
MGSIQRVQRKLVDFITHKKAVTLKLGLLGTHGTGKTTLGFTVCSRLKARHYIVEFIAEIARTVPTSLTVNQGTNFGTQYWILNTQINKEILAQLRQPQMLVTDRTVLDNFAYAYRAANVGQISPEDLAVLELKCRHWMATYDFLFYTPIPSRSIEQDGFRATDRAFQKEIDHIIQQLIQEWALSVVPIEGDNETRTRKILATVFETSLKNIPSTFQKARVV